MESLYNENEARVIKLLWAGQDLTVLIGETMIFGVFVIKGLEPQLLLEEDFCIAPPFI